MTNETKAIHPALDPSTWHVGDKIKSIEDDVTGTVVEEGYAAVKVRWSDGVSSQIGRQSNVAGRFEKVC